MDNLKKAPPRGRLELRRAFALVCRAIVFGLAYTQAPLYYSNQHQYFLHGLAQAGLGHLDRDWLANTTDPTPLFSILVAWTYRFLREELFYVYYVLVQGVYFWSLLSLFGTIAKTQPNRLTRLCFATLLLVVHAGGIRLLSAVSFGVDYPWYLQAGIAGQYVLGFGLQPSVAGVFLLASVAVFLRDKPFLAATLACLAAILHGTYMLGAAFLIASYMILRLRESGLRAALLLGSWALLLVLPAVIYQAVQFAPSSSDVFAESQHLLAHTRIPHHALAEKWCDSIVVLQVAWMVAAMVLVRGTRFFVILLVIFALSLALTLIQVVTGSDTLALLFPWRTSAILVPIATTVILGRIVLGLGPWLERRSHRQRLALQAGCVATIGAAVACGIAIMALGWGYRSNPDELPMLDFVKANQRSGEVYLLPVNLPKLGSGPRGVISTNFTPAPRKDKDKNLIAIDLQSFRLYTGAPIYVDFKSIPYKDAEVLEWHRRLSWCGDIYEKGDWDRKEVIESLTDKGITRVIMTANRNVSGPLLEMVHEDKYYRVYRVRPTAGTTRVKPQPAREISRAR